MSIYLGLTRHVTIQPLTLFVKIWILRNNSLTKCFSSHCYLCFLVISDIFVLFPQWLSQCENETYILHFFLHFISTTICYTKVSPTKHKSNLLFENGLSRSPVFERRRKCFHTVTSLYKKTTKSNVFFIGQESQYSTDQGLSHSFTMRQLRMRFQTTVLKFMWRYIP